MFKLTLSTTMMLFLMVNFLKGQPISLKAQIDKILPGVEINKLNASDHFLEEYEILIPQMVDHKDPKAGTFMQRVFLGHFDYESPIVMVTEGYSANDVTYEIAKKLRSNQLIVEYRYFGKSVPEDAEWKYLTNENAMKDLHRIHVLFSKIYKSKNWITTGISKGGTTCLFYEAAYPKDSRIAIPYVGPMADSPTDVRCDEHLKSIGDSGCRQALMDFQERVLDQKEEILPKLDSMSKQRDMVFSMGIEKALEYSVLELSFSFWQYAHQCDKIPTNSTPNQSFQYLESISGFAFYADATIDYFRPSFYQFMTENGYYGFVHEHLDDKLTEIKQFNNQYFAPRNTDLTYRPEFMIKAKKKLTKRKRVLQIQGELDPWSACGLKLEGKDQFYFVKQGGGHSVRIASFEKEKQDEIWNIIYSWMK
ncbi:S28 family serine protease [Portibacter lacus]|nr:S28 family serine protease [Portibacter lacus]